MIWAEHFDSTDVYGPTAPYSLNTAGNIFFSDGYADYFGILNGAGSSCFSGGCTDNEPAYVGSWPGFTKPYLVGEDLDAEMDKYWFKADPNKALDAGMDAYWAAPSPAAEEDAPAAAEDAAAEPAAEEAAAEA